MKKRNLENLSDEEFALIMKPIYPSNKEYWLEAYYVGIRPCVMKSMIEMFKSNGDYKHFKEMLKYYIYFDIDWYVNENNYYPLVTTFEHHAHFLGVDLNEYKEALGDLLLDNLVDIREMDDDFVVMMPKSPCEYESINDNLDNLLTNGTPASDRWDLASELKLLGNDK